MIELENKLKRLMKFEKYSGYIGTLITLLIITCFFSITPSSFVANLLLYWCISFLIFSIIVRIYISFLKGSLLKFYAFLESDPSGDSVFTRDFTSGIHQLATGFNLNLNLSPYSEDKLRTKSIPRLTFKINEYLSLHLEKNDKTKIYINDKEFIQCKFLLLNINSESAWKYDQIKSIDDVEHLYDKSLENGDPSDFNITPEQEFKAHCSNLQTWFECNYDTRILHSNISFPLLKRLTIVGDPKAKIRFGEEIVKRYLEGNYNVRKFLELEGYLNYLTIDQIIFLVRELLEKESKINLHILLENQDIVIRDESKTPTGRLSIPRDEDDNLRSFTRYSDIGD